MRYGRGYKSKKRNKYGASKTVVNGQKFDSQKAADRYQELKMLERAGIIRKLKRQVHFQLTPVQREPDIIGPRGGVKKGKMILDKSEYVADFTYIDNETERLIVEDVKGYKGGEAYRTFKLKQKFLYHTRGILIHET